MTVQLTDTERQLLVLLVTKEWVEIRHDECLVREAMELEDIIRKISGVDKRLTVEEVR